jgi:hypothetical protein
MPYTRRKHGGKKRYKKGGLKFFNKTKSNPFKKKNSKGRFSPQFLNPLEKGKITGAYGKAVENTKIAALRKKHKRTIFNRMKPKVPPKPKRIPGVRTRGIITGNLTSPRLSAPPRVASLPAPPKGGKRRKRTRRKRRRRRRRTRKRR